MPSQAKPNTSSRTRRQIEHDKQKSANASKRRVSGRNWKPGRAESRTADTNNAQMHNRLLQTPNYGKYSKREVKGLIEEVETSRFYFSEMCLNKNWERKRLDQLWRWLMSSGGREEGRVTCEAATLLICTPSSPSRDIIISHCWLIVCLLTFISSHYCLRTSFVIAGFHKCLTYEGVCRPPGGGFRPGQTSPHGD